jgi:hypothetical protein
MLDCERGQLFAPLDEEDIGDAEAIRARRRGKKRARPSRRFSLRGRELAAIFPRCIS